MAEIAPLDPAVLAAAAPLALAADDLAVFILSVGDGDATVIRFPDRGAGPAFGVIDSYDGGKTIALLEALGAADLAFVCATHPHYDHIAGLPAVLRRFPVGDYWDSGFRFTSKTYASLVGEVERRGLAFRRPTAGYEEYRNGVRLAVLSPSIALRNRYDTYGVDVNNASIVLRLTYPERPPSADYPRETPLAGGGPAEPPTRSILLGGDAQSDAWGTVINDFPHVVAAEENWARQIGARSGNHPLFADLLKVAHHGSKHGVNLELLERIGDRTGSGISTGPAVMVVSCGDNFSKHGFPHAVTQALMRETRDPKAKHGGPHRLDHQLGIHYTGQRLGGPGGGFAGSVAFVVGGDGTRTTYRLGEAEDDAIDLGRARRVR
jgi:beta-lactamase superfamily II metal-dependent hydrolase